MKRGLVLASGLLVLAQAIAQERALLPPPPPPMRNPMLLPERAIPVPPSLGSPVVVEPESPGWVLRRGDSGQWQVLWEGRWLGENQMMGNERIVKIDEYGIQVKGPHGKKNIPIIGVHINRQQKGK